MPLITVAREDLHAKIAELEHEGHRIGSIIRDGDNQFLVFVDVPSGVEYRGDR